MYKKSFFKKIHKITYTKNNFNSLDFTKIYNFY